MDQNLLLIFVGLFVSYLTYMITKATLKRELSTSKDNRKIVSELICTAGDIYLKHCSPESSKYAMLLINAAEHIMDPKAIVAYMNVPYTKMKPILQQRIDAKKSQQKQTT